jgi:hypothetical protein
MCSRIPVFYSVVFEAALSCSMICLLQLHRCFSLCLHVLALWKALLSTWEESVRLWHFVPYFPLGADLPEDCCDAENDGCHDGCVGLPVVWLRVPTT